MTGPTRQNLPADLDVELLGHGEAPGEWWHGESDVHDCPLATEFIAAQVRQEGDGKF